MRRPQAFLAAVVALTAGAANVHAQRPAVACASLIAHPPLHLTITQAVEVTEGKLQEWDSVPRFCRVVGVLSPVRTSEIAFEIWLPLEGWNGKLSAVGHGGWAGYINYDGPVGGGMLGQLRRGYAATSTNTGHVAKPGIDMARFAYDNPEALVDFAWRAQHEGAVAARAMVERFYGRAPSHSYFFGSSSGGRQALISAQRFPGDYDGIVAAAPAHDFTALFSSGLDLYLFGAADTAARMSQAQLQALARAVVAACDGRDGAVDGIVSAPRDCTFNPESLACPAVGGNDCLTPPQRALIRRAYAGFRHPATDSLVMPGFERGFERGLFGYSRPAGVLTLATAYYRWVVERDSTWTVQSVAAGTAGRLSLFKDVDRFAAMLDATNPDLSAFRARGGKLILSHGWNDEVIPPGSTINYLERVVAKLGGGAAGWRRADAFVRLFLVPARSHQGWNPNLQTALEAWVEQGRAPDGLDETLTTIDGKEVARRLCRYAPLRPNSCPAK